MQETMLALMGDYGYEGIAFLIWLENVFPPIPSEVVLLFGGFLTTRTALTPWGVILFATIGSTLGAAVLYGLGRIIGKDGRSREIMERLSGTKVSVYGKTVAILGYPEQIRVARAAIEMLLDGAPHGNVYSFLERKHEDLAKMELEEQGLL